MISFITLWFAWGLLAAVICGKMLAYAGKKDQDKLAAAMKLMGEMAVALRSCKVVLAPEAFEDSDCPCPTCVTTRRAFKSYDAFVASKRIWLDDDGGKHFAYCPKGKLGERDKPFICPPFPADKHDKDCNCYNPGEESQCEYTCPNCTCAARKE